MGKRTKREERLGNSKRGDRGKEEREYRGEIQGREDEESRKRERSVSKKIGQEKSGGAYEKRDSSRCSWQWEKGKWHSKSGTQNAGNGRGNKRN